MNLQVQLTSKHNELISLYRKEVNIYKINPYLMHRNAG